MEKNEIHTMMVTQQEENKDKKQYSLIDLEEMLKNNIKPPGILEYNDLPPEIPLEPSQSKKEKAKKVFIKINKK